MESGTLSELNVHLGDVVQCVDSSDSSFVVGENYTCVEGKDGFGKTAVGPPNPRTGIIPINNSPILFCVVSRANPAPTGPVRTVTRKEIVPGRYGNVEISHHNEIAVSWMDANAVRLRKVIATLTEIADALEENDQ